ncbi:MAG: hypothetical protein CMI63_15400 [Parvularcula sp.]|nr:hypothetical protein [Parvularcula sp.]
MGGATIKTSGAAMPTGRGYVDAIDGLRALAVLLVLLFHAGFTFASGGFVGVDVFFVISGFLITSNIVRDIERGDWSFSRFYTRRIARLLPALFTVLFFTLAAAFFILSPTDLERLGRSSLYAALSGSNIFFWLEANYFDQAANTKPLLHTWSLGVEEQFYLIWPLLVLGFHRWRARRGVLIGMMALGAISLAAAFLTSPHLPSAVFFLTPFRIYQFVLGALVALGLTLAQGNKAGLAGFVAAAALLAIAYAANGETSPYWLAAFAPALAAAIFIWAAESPIVKLVFGSTPMRWIGQRSYAIYLIHWPIMVLWPLATDFELSVAEGWLAIAASVATGAILHAAVEKPLRFYARTTPEQRHRRLGLVAAMLLAVIVPAAHFWGLNGVPGRLPEELLLAVANEDALLMDRRRIAICQQSNAKPMEPDKLKSCVTPPEERRASVFVLGDSLATDVAASLRFAYPNFFIGQHTGSGCVISRDRDAQAKGKAWCVQLMNEAIEQSLDKNTNYRRIILLSNWRIERVEDLNDIIQDYNASGITPIIFGPRATFTERVPAIAYSSKSIADAERRAQLFRDKKYDRAAEIFPRKLRGDYEYIDFIEMQCPNGVCPIFDEDENLLYMDRRHFTGAGIKWFAKRLRAEHPRILYGYADKMTKPASLQ